MKAFMGDFNGIATALKSGPYSSQATIPASPWLGERKPGRPEIHLSEVGNVSLGLGDNGTEG